MFIDYYQLDRKFLSIKCLNRFHLVGPKSDLSPTRRALLCVNTISVKNLPVSRLQKPEPDDNFRTYKMNDSPSRFIASLNFDNK